MEFGGLAMRPRKTPQFLSSREAGLRAELQAQSNAVDSEDVERFGAQRHKK